MRGTPSKQQILRSAQDDNVCGAVPKSALRQRVHGTQARGEAGFPCGERGVGGRGEADDLGGVGVIECNP